MRGLADGYDLLRLVIETRKDQTARQSWTIAARDKTASAAANGERIAAATQFFAKPDGRHCFADWLRILLEEVFVTDAAALYMRRDRAGRLSALMPLDGATIKPVIDGFSPTAMEQIIGRFNDALLGCAFVFCDEVLFAGDLKAANALKALSTTTRKGVETKGLPIISMPIAANLWLASNADQPVHIEGGDARYWILRPSEARIGDHAYFEALGARSKTEAARLSRICCSTATSRPSCRSATSRATMKPAGR